MITVGVPKGWGDDLNELRADYPDLRIWTISGYRWLMAEATDEQPLQPPRIRRRTPELLREALEAWAHGEPVPLDLGP